MLNGEELRRQMTDGRGRTAEETISFRKKRVEDARVESYVDVIKMRVRRRSVALFLLDVQLMC